jgi:hydroxymethylbilane synthase
MKDRFVIGTRGSDLAMWQANALKVRLQNLAPGTIFAISVIKTTGDEIVDVALSKIGDKGLFTRQIETELLNGGIDFAVHSLKDLQTMQPDGLCIGAVFERELPNDAFISRKYATLADLPEGGTVATGSLRRRSQLLNYRPDLRIVEIRGNVPTRLRKFDESDLDAMILAFAGLHRLGLDSRLRELIPFEIMLPAVGQGVIAVEIRKNDEEAADLMKSLDHPETRACITAERAFLRWLEGGCQVPIGALAHVDGERIRLEGMIGDLDGVVLRDRMEGSVDTAEEVGINLAKALVSRGGAELLARTRSDVSMSADRVL